MLGRANGQVNVQWRKRSGRAAWNALGGKPSALRPETYRAGQPGELNPAPVSLALVVGSPLRPSA